MSNRDYKNIDQWFLQWGRFSPHQAEHVVPQQNKCLLQVKVYILNDFILCFNILLQKYISIYLKRCTLKWIMVQWMVDYSMLLWQWYYSLFCECDSTRFCQQNWSRLLWLLWGSGGLFLHMALDLMLRIWIVHCAIIIWKGLICN